MPWHLCMLLASVPISEYVLPSRPSYPARFRRSVLTAGAGDASAGEILLGSVEAVQRGELFGAQDAERFENLRADLVLAAVAPSRGRECRAKSLPAIELHQQAVVLIVGVGGRHHEDAGVREVP